MISHSPQTATRSRRYFLASVWLTWTAIAVLSYARTHLEAGGAGNPSASLSDFLSLWVGCFCPGALLTPAIFRFEARFPLTKVRWKERLGILALGSLLFSWAGLKIGHLLGFGLNYVLGRPASLSGFLWHFSFVEFYFEQFFFWSTLSAACAIRHFVQYHRQAQQATQLALEKSQLEASLRQAELENLRTRLNPHFLFNTLQNVSVLAQQNPKLASQMLARLGDVLRAALRRNVSLETTVRDEIALTQDYLAVEKMRFGDRLTVLVDVAPEADQALIPTFLLQPLAENAVIHGLRDISQMGTIAMRAEREGDQLVLTVADNGCGLSDTLTGERNVRLGIGLSSTRDRLDRMYPGEHEFVIRNLPECGTEVRIAIPFRLRELSEENVHDEQPATVNR